MRVTVGVGLVVGVRVAVAVWVGVGVRVGVRVAVTVWVGVGRGCCLTKRGNVTLTGVRVGVDVGVQKGGAVGIGRMTDKVLLFSSLSATS